MQSIQYLRLGTSKRQQSWSVLQHYGVSYSPKAAVCTQGASLGDREVPVQQLPCRRHRDFSLSETSKLWQGRVLYEVWCARSVEMRHSRENAP